MSATLDTNILVYASDKGSRFHEPAKELLEERSSGTGLLYLFWPVLLGYWRIVTHPAIFEAPMTPAAVRENLEALVKRRNVRSPSEDENFWHTFQTVTDATIVRGNLVPDAHIVALMRLHGVATLYSHDRDFRKFEGLKVIDPFGS